MAPRIILALLLTSALAAFAAEPPKAPPPPPKPGPGPPAPPQYLRHDTAAIPKAPPPAPKPGPGAAALAEYFRHETAAIANASLADVHTAADWDARRPEARRQLAEMLGLDPAPPRTDLKPVVTGKIDHPEVTV